MVLYKEKRTKQKNKKKYTHTLGGKIHGLHFVLVNYSQVWGLPWSVVDTFSDDPVRGGGPSNNFLCQQISIAIPSSLGVKFCIHLYPCWDFVWFELHTGLMHAKSLCEFIVWILS